MRRYEDLTIEVIGKRLKTSRKEHNRSQTAVAEHLGVDVGTVSRYETGNIEIPVSKLIKYGEACDYEPKNYLRREYEGIEELYDLLSDKPGIPKSVQGWADNAIDLENLPDEKVDLSDDVIEIVKAYKRISEIPSLDPDLAIRLKEEVRFHLEINGFLGNDTARDKIKQRL